MEKRKLLQKYNIPISHLDYGYIGSCTNVKELEKIVTILLSGEEGYFPDLTKFAEEKLKQLNPTSKSLRREGRILTKNSLSAEEWEQHVTPIKEWSTEIKSKDSILSTIQEKLEKADDNMLPPIRKSGKVTGKKDQSDVSTAKPSSGTAGGGGSRTGSTDYRAWDKFDADAELLKMDLEEERVKEHVERMNRINKEKSTAVNTIGTEDNKKDMLEKLSEIEKEKLSEEIRGNEYFRSKEYENALKQYTRCIEIMPTVASYNNRAITNIKLLRYPAAISDCNECLKLEPRNLKALLRKGEALQALGKKVDACQIYEQVSMIEPDNELARKALTHLKNEVGEIPPSYATRINIIEENSANTSKPAQSKSEPIETPKPKPKPPAKPVVPVNYDYAELIKPKKVVKSSLAKTMESIGKLTPKREGNKPSSASTTGHLKGTEEPEIKLGLEDPGMTSPHVGKCLIQEL